MIDNKYDSNGEVQNDTACTRLDCCRNCVNISLPLKMGARFRFFGRAGRRSPPCLAGSAPHKSGSALDFNFERAVGGSILTAGKKLSLKNLNVTIRAIN